MVTLGGQVKSEAATTTDVDTRRLCVSDSEPRRGAAGAGPARSPDSENQSGHCFANSCYLLLVTLQVQVQPEAGPAGSEAPWLSRRPQWGLSGLGSRGPLAA